jgi:hypothetical protein
VYFIAAGGPVRKRHVAQVSQHPFLQKLRIAFIALVVLPLNDTTHTHTTPFLTLTHSPARYFDSLQIFKACGLPKISVALIARDPDIVRDAGANSRAGLERSVTPVLHASSAALAACGAHVPFSHGRNQVRDDVIMAVVVEKVDPSGCGYLAVKHDVTLQARIHRNPVFRKWR